MTLDEYEQKVLRAIEPEYDVMVLIIPPSRAGVNDFAAADALAGLKKKGLIKFEGRGKFKSCYLTPEGEAAYADLPAA
jgi:hypothetical protein